jgi:hypothetical protein
VNGFGATLLMRDLTSMAVIVPGVVLPSAGWQALGKTLGLDGYRYRDPAPGGIVCKSVTVAPERVKFDCRTFMLAGTLPATGDIGVRLNFAGATGNAKTFCAQLGGSEARNDEGGLKRKDAPASTECMSP